VVVVVAIGTLEVGIERTARHDAPSPPWAGALGPPALRCRPANGLPKVRSLVDDDACSATPPRKSCQRPSNSSELIVATVRPLVPVLCMAG